MKHITFKRNPRASSKPDLTAAFAAVPKKIEAAARKASKQLKEIGARHALIGGLAVGAYGHPRTTGDVDFLVGDELFIKHKGGVVTIDSAFPIAIGDVSIDPVGIIEPHLEAPLNNSPESENIPVVPVEVLVYLKLKAGRHKDLGDVEGLIEAGLDVTLTRQYLKRYAPKLLVKFNKLIEET